MTFNEFIDKIEHERAHCQDEFDTRKSVKDYLQMGHYIAIIRAYDWVLELAKDVAIGETKHNDFSLENVNIGDKCVCIDGRYGVVSRLIYNSDGYCCGMVMCWDGSIGEEACTNETFCLDNGYLQFKQIGSWVNE